MKKLIFLIPLICLLTGCYNYRELNDLAIVSGASVSKIDDTYKITVEVINPKKEQDTSSGKEPDYVIYEGTGSSMQEALRNVVKEAPKKLYGAQLDILIIDEATAREGVADIIDFFARDPEIRSQFYVVVSDSDESLKIISPLINISSKTIVNSLESTNTYLGTASLVTYHQFISNHLNPHLEIALPSIKVIGDDEIGETNLNVEQTTTEANNVIGPMTVFKNGKLLGYLTPEESLGYNIITNNTQTFLMRSEYKNEDFIVNEVIDASTEMKAKVKDKKITIEINGTAAISEVNYNIDLEKEETIKKIEKDFNEDIEELVKKTINSINEKYNSDIYGFKDLFYKTNPKEYKNLIKEVGDDFLSSLDIEVKSNINLIEKGNLNGGIYNE